MLSPRYFIMAAVGPGLPAKVAVSSHPPTDAGCLAAAGYREIWLIQPPLPLWIAEKVGAQLGTGKLPTTPKAFQKQAVFYLEPYISRRLIRLVVEPISEGMAAETVPSGLERLFQGRIVLGTEIPAVVRENGYDLPWDPEVWMQGLVAQGKVRRKAAVTRESWGSVLCRRCGSREGIREEYCYLCGSTDCLTCYNCQSMGLAKSCIPLYSADDHEEKADERPVVPILDFELTLPQRRAAEHLEAFYLTEASRFLVWAVCGSGKTEVSFGIVAKVLSRGGRVLFAIPRRDIVIELLPRFEKAFPGVSVAALYGGSGGRWAEGSQLTLATTHQCLRFYHRFDLVVLDEADAFPYQGSHMLHYAVERAVKPGGKLVIMTATPSRNLIEQAEAGTLPSVSIPARHHGRPLVVPAHRPMALQPLAEGHQWRIPEPLETLIRESAGNGRKLLIFLPTLPLVEVVGRQLVLWGAKHGICGDWTHSRRENRTDVKHRLLDGKLHFVVTSTVFERGITIPDVDVIVLYADYDAVFDSRTLIQIAGRAGRHGDPAAVYFVSKTVTRAMKDCCDTIRRMNGEAVRLGYILPEVERRDSF